MQASSTQVDLEYDIVPTHLAVRAMRDNGYKNTSFAVAELIDNAIQAGAKQVELLCKERTVQRGASNVSSLDCIAVLDNGLGMTPDVLRMALQFGNGTRLDPTQHTGIGRFGMGLPASSISQCKRVDVWSWQEGVASAWHTFLDLDDILNTGQKSVPEPVQAKIPALWGKVGKSFGESGTLIVWSKVDRCMWRTASGLIKNSELLIGRVYRKFLDENKVRIRMTEFNEGNISGSMKEKWAKPNDPLYLMPETSCPTPWNNTSMFEQWGTDVVFKINFNGEEHPVTLRYSLAKKEAREKDNSGSEGYGQHAKKNVGISIVRAGRELDLDQGLINAYDPRERWWGAEIDFPPALDELFGVSNNKQSARNLSDLFSQDLETLLDGETLQTVKERMKQEDDPKGPLLDIVQQVRATLNVLRGLIKQQAAGKRGKKRHETSTAETTATQKTKQRQEQGYTGKSDADEGMPDSEKKKELTAILTNEGISTQDATQMVAHTVSNGLKYLFAHSSSDSSAFFSVKPKAGVITILLNSDHPVYDKLVDILEKEVEEVDVATLQERLTNALEGLKLLLSAWARYEDELEGPRKAAAQDARGDWGKIARDFLATE
ncbi:ATP-binding protein [Hymenobacter sp. BT770]|uniref:ATP-binding protein n=1 Tax=Hymenobacter sp. BT770 TaxID=2886942 RepID=UPI001D101274|nr:ATP-binding protein [Hymenobacter sp. BT770]MCC3154613.1 ATP-binding protein [Hymenobacter sp. BT770]MDO3416667.1 ATP-binding protein [Hymenobacter sp. BT770]